MNQTQSTDKRGARGMRRLLWASVNSFNGLRVAWHSEEAVRQELVLLAASIPLALIVTEVAVERVLLIGSVVLVLIVELLNTAVECAIDRIGPEHHELSGKAKDIGSAAVMVSLMLAGLVWVMLAI